MMVDFCVGVIAQSSSPGLTIAKANKVKTLFVCDDCCFQSLILNGVLILGGGLRIF
jgi:hypothetical protein